MDIVIMDLDGVLCANSQRAHLVPPADQQHRNEAWRPFVAECVNDAPIAEGIAMYKALVGAHKVVIVTSRQRMFREETKDWLSKNGISKYTIVFRPDSNNDSPAEYKRKAVSMLRSKKGHNILFAIDDDPAIVAMYNAEGVPTFQPSTRCSSCK